ncbi:MAG: hypothetical protein J0M00_17590 [Burkholderiales bacterium]|nr:hypothetical protein [Burkholderiales bacterium]
MKIISTLLPAAPSDLASGKPTIVMALDTLVDQKPLVVGLTVGALQGPQLTDVALSQVGQVIVERCIWHQELNYPDGAVLIAGVARVGDAKERVRKVLAQAAPGTFVLLVCADDKVYDAAYPALCVDLKSANANPQ